MRDIRVGVVGLGVMGTEIACVCALGGYAVSGWAFDDAEAEKAKSRIERMVTRGITDETERKAILGSIKIDTSFDVFKDCKLVIESVLERQDIKESTFAKLEQVINKNTIIASNTSSLGIEDLCAKVEFKDRFIGIHFFNPPTMMELVEVISQPSSSSESIDFAMEFVKNVNKTSVLVKDSPGFIVNRVLIAGANQAIRILEEGIASPHDIDEAMKLGAGFKMGPIKMADLVGLDVQYHASKSLYDRTGDSAFKPPEILKKMVEEGKLGRKTRQGFYKYGL